MSAVKKKRAGFYQPQPSIAPKQAKERRLLSFILSAPASHVSQTQTSVIVSQRDHQAWCLCRLDRLWGEGGGKVAANHGHLNGILHPVKPQGESATVISHHKSCPWA